MSVVSRRDVNSRGRWRTVERGISTSLLRESLHENKVNHLKIKQKIIRTSMPTKTGEITTKSQFNHSLCWFSILGLEIHLIHLQFSTKKNKYAFFQPSRAVRKKRENNTRDGSSFRKSTQKRWTKKQNLTA